VSFGWGFVGPGGIAHKVAAALAVSSGGHLAAVASRDAGRAQAFADEHGGDGTRGGDGEHGPAHAYGGPDAVDRLLADPSVDVVYVATVHPHHHAPAKQALEAGTPVLVEKPLTVSLAATQDLVDTARARSTFLMEAYWTRMLPGTQALLDVVASGEIGDVRAVRADLGFRAPTDAPRFHDVALGGGSVFDLGPYPVGLALTLLGRPTQVRSVSTLTPTGVDGQTTLVTTHAGGRTATLATSIESWTRSGAWIEGTAGSIEIEAQLFDVPRLTVRTERGETVHDHRVEHGHHYMLDHVHECLTDGLTESPLVGFDFSLDLAAVLEQAVEQGGIARLAERVGG